MKLIKVKCKDNQQYNVGGFTWEDQSFFGSGNPWWATRSKVDPKTTYHGKWRTPKTSVYLSSKWEQDYEGIPTFDVSLKDLKQYAAQAEKRGTDISSLKKIITEFEAISKSHRQLLKQRWS